MKVKVNYLINAHTEKIQKSCDEIGVKCMARGLTIIFLIGD